MVPQGVTRAVVRERDRQPLNGALPGEGFQLIVDVFTETGARGRIDTWRLDMRRPRDSTERQPWRIIAQEKLSTIDGLHRLGLHTDEAVRRQEPRAQVDRFRAAAAGRRRVRGRNRRKA